MPRDRTQQMAVVDKLGEAPNAPHLAVLSEFDGSGHPVFSPLPTEVREKATPGAILAIVMDPRNPKSMIPFIITKVTPKRIEARCACGLSSCSRRYAWNIVVRGLHPYGKPEIGVQK